MDVSEVILLLLVTLTLQNCFADISIHSRRTLEVHRWFLRPGPQERDLYRDRFWTVLQFGDLEMRAD